MFSPSKHSDSKFLLEVSELILLLVKLNTTQSLDLAEKFGDYYVELQTKIATYDYTKDDQTYYELISWTIMSKLNTSPYFTHLTASASQGVKYELQQAARKPNSFASVRTVLNGKYGQPKTK